MLNISFINNGKLPCFCARKIKYHVSYHQLILENVKTRTPQFYALINPANVSSPPFITTHRFIASCQRCRSAIKCHHLSFHRVKVSHLPEHVTFYLLSVNKPTNRRLCDRECAGAFRLVNVSLVLTAEQGEGGGGEVYSPISTI